MIKIPFPFIKGFYRRNNYGEPYVWYGEVIGTNTIKIYYGIVGKNISNQIIFTTRDANKELQSKIKAKLKEGYITINEIRDCGSLPVEESLQDFLNKYLPIIRTTDSGTTLAMLAKAFDNTNNKLFKNTDYYLGQWKINGLRCIIHAEIDEQDIFKKVRLKFISREGTVWNSLSNLEEYLLMALPEDIINDMIYYHFALDGELYLPGYSVNQIDHIIKDSKCIENSKIQYWCYDLITEYTSARERYNYLLDKLGGFLINLIYREQHLRNNNRFVLLPSTTVTTEMEALSERNNYIDLGFEGLILRNPYTEYACGKRSSKYMIKYKSVKDGVFTIMDIYPEDKRDIPLIKVKNDINDATFEVHINGTFEYQKDILKNRDKYINKQLFITFGERSGVNKVPFHVKEVRFWNY